MHSRQAGLETFGRVALSSHVEPFDLCSMSPLCVEMFTFFT